MCNNREETTTPTTLWEFLETNTVEIPIIQRDYAQGRIGKEKLRETFLKDLKEALGKEKILKLDFIYGSTENSVFHPLDGQQRLTTLWLLHWYIAYKASKLSEVKKTLAKFTYETRVSSREFCQKILELSANGEENVVKHIKSQTWFYSEWLQDPTIQAMLNMIGGTSVKRDKGEEIIDGLEEVFDNVTKNEYEKYWRLLTGDNCPIQFYTLKLQDFGLTDDLYIKMNARGKPLTFFENFKADVIGYINDNDKCQNWEEKRLMNQNKEECFKKTFSHKIDTIWTDLFWKYRSKNNKIDDAFFNFFARYFLNYLIVNKGDSEEKIKEYSLYKELYRSEANKEKIEYNGFNNYEIIFDEKSLKSLKNTLDNIINHQPLFDFFAPYWGNSENKKREAEFYLIPQYENEEIKGITDNERVIFFAICRYFEQISEQDEEKLEETLKQWMRVVWNIVENSDANLVGKLRLIKELSEYTHSIYNFLADEEKVIISDFASEQVKEEREKVKLILKSENWKEAIIEAENHGYFKGQIGFLLDWSKDKSDQENIDNFKKYKDKAVAIFNNDGLKNFDNFLFERALLATGTSDSVTSNYLLSKGRNWSFLINNERDISWKRLLRDKNEKRKILKQLIDKLPSSSKEEIENELQEIINKFSDKNDWRYYFVKQPEMIDACGSQKLIRWNSKFDILLLGSTVTSGYHREYYSYSLFVELNDDKIKYCPQRSVDRWKYFEYNNKKIAFCSNNEVSDGKFILLEEEENEWNVKKEFNNKKEVKEEIGLSNAEEELK